MNLESDKRLNIQWRLDFSSAPTGEARQAGREDIESLSVVGEPERPANTSRIMEEICERANSKEALRRRPDDGRSTRRLSEAALAVHSGAIAEQDLRTETGEAGGNPEAGWRRDAKAWHPDSAGSLHPASGNAGSAEAMEPDILPIQLRVSTASIGASRRGSSAAVYCARLRMGDRPRFGKIFRSSQS